MKIGDLDNEGFPLTGNAVSDENVRLDARIEVLEAIVVALWGEPPWTPRGERTADTPDEYGMTEVESNTLKEVLLKRGYCEWCWVSRDDECVPDCAAPIERVYPSSTFHSPTGH
jgi:hypothetical protein